MSDRAIARKNPSAKLSPLEVKAALRQASTLAAGDRLSIREPGLLLRVYPDRNGVWSLERKRHGVPCRRRLGTTDELSLSEARAARDLTWSQILNNKDPLAIERAERAAEAAARETRRRQREGQATGGDTLAMVLDRFEKLKGSSKSWFHRRRAIECHFKRQLNLPAAGLEEDDARAVLDAAMAKGKPIGAKRAVRYLSRIYSWAIKRKELEANPCRALDLNELTRSEPPRQVTLEHHEIRALWAAATRAGSPYGDLAKLYLLLGQRRQELANARWDQIVTRMLVMSAPPGTPPDTPPVVREVRVLLIPTNKSDRPHELPLPTAASQIIDRQRRTGDKIFTMTARPNWEYWRDKLSADAGIMKLWWWHDLRRSCRTELDRLRVDDLTAELILNHQMPGRLRNTYNCYRRAPEMLEALEMLAAHLERIATGKIADIVDLPKAG